MFPMDSIAKVRALPDDLNNQTVPDAQLRYLFVDSAGPVLLEGKRPAVASTTDKDTYVLFGATRPALVEASKKGVVFLELHDATHSVFVELPKPAGGGGFSRPGWERARTNFGVA